MQEFKNDYYMLSEFETIEIFNHYLATFHIHASTIFLESLENLYLNISIIDVKLFILSKLSCYNFSSRIFVIYTLNNLSESSLINYFDYFISISKLFTNSG